MSLSPSPAGIGLIQGFETCSKFSFVDHLYHAYLPTPRDFPTIGWGTTGPDIHLGMAWSRAQCDTRFDDDVNSRFTPSLNAMLAGGASTSQNQFDALLSFAYNEGAHALQTSTLLKLHRAGQYAEAGAQFPRWNLQAGEVLEGLVRRRAAEQKLYMTGKGPGN